MLYKFIIVILQVLHSAVPLNSVPIVVRTGYAHAICQHRVYGHPYVIYNEEIENISIHIPLFESLLRDVVGSHNYPMIW